jgi:uncharacterized protein
LSSKSKKRDFTRVFFATDLHASEVAFRKFLGAVKFYDVDILIMGGDVFGKTFVPIVEDGAGMYQFEFNGQSFIGVPESKLGDYEREIADAGDYSRRFAEKEYDDLEQDHRKIQPFFEEQMVERMSHWAQLARENLYGTRVKCYWTGGNDDAQELLDKVASTESFVMAEGKVVRLDDGHELASLGWSNPTPWKTHRECNEEELAAKLSALERGVRDPGRCILNVHPPPYDSTLDIAGKLDTSTNPPRPVTSGGHQVMVPVGSTAVRAAIEKMQPLLMLCGHIHETKNATKIGKTLCINPGSEYGSGYLRGVIVNLKDGKVLSYQFTSG